MKTTDLTLDLQAYVDGELDATRRAEVERVLQNNAEARELVAGLRAIGQLVADNEPVHRVPVSREFYWSQIQRRIESGERVASAGAPAKPASAALHWLRWLVPALGVAAVAVVISVQRPHQPGQAIADTGTVTFHSDADGVTIHWIN